VITAKSDRGEEKLFGRRGEKGDGTTTTPEEKEGKGIDPSTNRTAKKIKEKERQKLLL